MPRVMPPRHTRNIIERPRKVIHHLALPLIPPLRADHHHRFHSSPFSVENRHSCPFSFSYPGPHYIATTFNSCTPRWKFPKNRQVLIVSSPSPQRKQQARSVVGQFPISVNRELAARALQSCGGSRNRKRGSVSGYGV